MPRSFVILHVHWNFWAVACSHIVCQVVAIKKWNNIEIINIQQGVIELIKNNATSELFRMIQKWARKQCNTKRTFLNCIWFDGSRKHDSTEEYDTFETNTHLKGTKNPKPLFLSTVQIFFWGRGRRWMFYGAAATEDDNGNNDETSQVLACCCCATTPVRVGKIMDCRGFIWCGTI